VPDPQAPAIRVLGAGDAAAMAAMNAMFGRVFEDPESYGGAPPGALYLARLLRSESFIAIAALDGETVVGGLAAYVLPKFEQARNEVYLYDLAVDAAYRRRGIATALIAALQREAAARDAWVVYVQADHGDAPAIALYTRLGTREDVLHFDIPPIKEPAP
jgi:aminoglycoside 3-N-acetyltransferase I